MGGAAKRPAPGIPFHRSAEMFGRPCAPCRDDRFARAIFKRMISIRQRREALRQNQPPIHASTKLALD